MSETLNARDFFGLGVGRVTKTLPLNPGNEKLRELLQQKEVQAKPKKIVENNPHKFNYVEPSIFKDYADIMDVRAFGHYHDRPSVSFVSSDVWLPSRIDANELTGRLGWNGEIADAALFVYHYAPVLNSGVPINIYFLGSCLTEYDGRLSAPCLSIHTAGCYLRQKLLTGFDAGTWLAFNPKV